MREGVKEDGSQYWEFFLLYVDNRLMISENAENVLQTKIGKYFKLKEVSIDPPDIYLDGKIQQVNLNNGAKCWSSSSSQYVQTAVKNVESYLKEKSKKFPTRKAEVPFSSEYRSEIDFSR